jgi:hypothetical protein
VQDVTGQVATLTLSAVAGTVTAGATSITGQVGTLTLAGIAGVADPGTAGAQNVTGQVGTLTLTAVAGHGVGLERRRSPGKSAR